MSFKYLKYQLPLAVPLQTSKTTFDNRKGYLLEYTGNGFTCYGETAPLTGFSKESLDDVLQSIKKIEHDVTRILQYEKPAESLRDLYKEHQVPSSLQFGLDTLAYKIEAEHTGVNLQQYLFDNAGTKIPVNALVSLSSEHVINEVEDRISKGFKTIKCKVGIDFDSEFKTLKKIRDRFPELAIRLDANQAWTLEEALPILKNLEILDIEYCEEPLKNISPENFEALHHHTNVPLALDESILQVKYWPNLLPFSGYIILKPMFIGSFTNIIETNKLANTHNNKTVFTTSLESGVGRTMTAILASGLGNPTTAHGLATGKLFAGDFLGDSIFISEGYYHLQDQQSLNVDLTQLEKYCLAYEG